MAGSTNGTIQILQASPYQNFLSNIQAHAGRILAINQLMNNLVVTASDDTFVKLWQPSDDPPYITLLSTFTGHTKSVFCVLEMNSSTLVSGSSDGTVRLWDVNSGQLKLTLNVTSVRDGTQAVKGLSRHPDGRSLITVDTEKNVKFWNLSDSTFITFATLNSELNAVRRLLNSTKIVIATSNNCGTNSCNTTATPKYDRGSIWIFDVANGTVPVKVLGDTYLPDTLDLTTKGNYHTDSVTSLTVYYDSITWEANPFSASADTTVKLWNFTTNTAINFESHYNKIANGIGYLYWQNIDLMLVGSLDSNINAYNLTDGHLFGAYSTGLQITSLSVAYLDSPVVTSHALL